MSSNESLSNKVGNTTGGTVGDETLLHQAVGLASHTFDYAKGVVGIGGAKSAASADDAAHGSQGADGKHTLGGLVDEARHLGYNALGTAQTYLGQGADKASDAAHDSKGSLVDTAKTHASTLIGTAQSYLAKGEEKTSNTSTNDIKASALGATDDAAKKVDVQTSGLQDSVSNASRTAQAYGQAGVNRASEQGNAALGKVIDKV